MMKEVNFCNINKFNVNFTFLNIIGKATWVLLQENQEILLALGTYIHRCFEKRGKNAKLIYN